MKKVLFATTALVASAGIAAAESHTGIEITGSAEMGVAGGTNMDLYFLQSVDVRFAMTGETDNGLMYGATIDLDDAGDVAGGNGLGDVGGNNANPDFTVFIGGSFGNLTMGDTDGAFDWALQEVNLVGGSLADDETAHAGFNGNSQFDGFGPSGGQIVRYDYSFDAFSFAVSVELDDVTNQDPNFQIGGKYSANFGGVDVGVGIGYATVGNTVATALATDNEGTVAGTDSSAVGISLDIASGGFSGAINYTSFDNVTLGAKGAVDSHLGIGVGYKTGPFGIGVNYGMYDAVAAGADSDGFGIAATYDLGPGATLQFGYGSGSTAGAATVDTYSFGISMSF